MFTTGRTPAHGGKDDDSTATVDNDSTSVNPTSQTTSGPDESVAKQLKAKLSERGREKKELVQTVEAQNQTIAELTELVKASNKPANPSDNGITEMDAYLDTVLSSEASTEEAKAALVAALKLNAKTTREEVTKELTERVEGVEKTQRAGDTYRFAESFFAARDVPELGRPGSDFFNFVTDKVAEGDPHVTWLWSGARSIPDTVYPQLFDKYLDSMGIKNLAPTSEDHKAAALADFPSAAHEVTKSAAEDIAAAQEKAGRPLTLDESRILLENKGHFDRD